MCGEGVGPLLPTPRGVSRFVGGSLPPSPGHFATSRKKEKAVGEGVGVGEEEGGLRGEGKGKGGLGVDRGQRQRKFSFGSDFLFENLISHSEIEEGGNGGRETIIETADQRNDDMIVNVSNKGVHEPRIIGKGREELELRKEGGLEKMQNSPIITSSKLHAERSPLTDDEVTIADNLLKPFNAQMNEISTDKKICGGHGSAFLGGNIKSIPMSNTVIAIEVSLEESASKIPPCRERIPSLSNSCLVR